jgi:drug/metabolite transporter (DMT)-like permease
MLPAVFTAMLFASSVIFGHRAAKLVGSLNANFWRVVLATLFLSLWAFTFGTGFSGGAVGWFAFSGVVGVGLGDFAYFYALPRLGPRVAALFNQCLMAPFGALIEWVWLGLHPTALQGLFGLVALGGVAIALRPGGATTNHPRISISGLLLGLVGALGGAGGAVISRKAYEVVHANGMELDGITAGFQRMLGGFGLSLLIYFALRAAEARRKSSEDLAPAGSVAKLGRPRRVWPWVLANALAGQTLGVSCLQWALATSASAAPVLVIVSTAPVLVIPLARIFEGERITIRAVAGALIAVAGVAGLILAK